MCFAFSVSLAYEMFEKIGSGYIFMKRFFSACCAGVSNTIWFYEIPYEYFVAFSPVFR